ncbi:hypothetical protein GCM10023219_31770 [Stakelama sediminis]|uniref:DUF2793 domain-containing protein n=1 Tax=Stakelama sediminis TaxID=463200 RepID=A0A840Z1R8_9SPHN|nr:DUF2793 domain-containing protein [Stakelama sediminis]MBB5719632.1 hypothetical protein [Stakelama sediminis]
MTEAATARLSLPLLSAGQAQKEMTHNEALTLIDMLMVPAVQAVGQDDPPGTPAAGECWIVGAAPTGDWVGQTNALACWTDGGWRFVSARAGQAIWSVPDDVFAVFSDQWQVGAMPVTRLIVDGQQVVGAQAASIADVQGGDTIDAEARDAVASILACLRTHGLIATA